MISFVPVLLWGDLSKKIVFSGRSASLYRAAYGCYAREDPSLSVFVATMVALCRDDAHGYSQYDRYGADFDCSSAVLFALRKAGWSTTGALTVDHLRSLLAPQGWAVLPPSSEKRPGDILIQADEHVAVYVGSGLIAEFSSDETGGIVGRHTGDQTGAEGRLRPDDEDPWTYILRYSPD